MKRIERTGKRLLATLPIVAALQAAMGDGIGTAEACAGGAPSTGWDLSVPILESEEQRLPIATDGFVLLTGAFSWEDAPEAEVPLPFVRVTTQSGEALPGRLRLLRSEVEDYMTFATFGWQADEALPLGTIATVSWSENEDDLGVGGAESAPNSVDSVEIEVVTEPAQLPKPVADLEEWVEVRHGIGELVECTKSSSCRTLPLHVPTHEVRVPGVGVSWTLPPIEGLVAWEVWGESADPDAGAVSLTPPRRQLVDRERDEISLVSDIVAFDAAATEHCAVIVVKDLRTGEESRSEPQCEEPGEPQAVVTDHQLRSCDSPPTQAGAGGQAGAGDAAGAGGGATDGNDPSVGGDAVASGSGGQRREGDDDGCSYVPASSGRSVGVLALGVALWLASRRRQRR